MLKEKRTGQHILKERAWNVVMDVDYGVLREQDTYGLLIVISGSLYDKKRDILFDKDESPLFFEAVGEVEKLTQLEDLGCVIITRINHKDDGCSFEIWKNLSLAKSEERRTA